MQNDQSENGSKAVVKTFKRLTMTLLMLSPYSLSGKASNRDLNDILARPPIDNYTTFHTDEYPFEYNSEKNLSKTLKEFAKTQNERGEDDEPVRIVFGKEIFKDKKFAKTQNEKGKDDEPDDIAYYKEVLKNIENTLYEINRIRFLLGESLPFKHLIVELDDFPSNASMQGMNFLARNKTTQSLQLIGSEDITEISFGLCMQFYELKILDISFFTHLNKIGEMFCFCSPLEIIYVAGKKQKQIVEDRFILDKRRKKMPKIILKTDNRHFSELKLEGSPK